MRIEYESGEKRSKRKTMGGHKLCNRSIWLDRVQTCYRNHDRQFVIACKDEILSVMENAVIEATRC